MKVTQEACDAVKRAYQASSVLLSAQAELERALSNVRNCRGDNDELEERVDEIIDLLDRGDTGEAARYLDSLYCDVEVAEEEEDDEDEGV